jgi:hypothetical protein
MTRPFLCKDDSGKLFYVKGGNADRRSLIVEWLCARLATAFGLPVAPCAIVNIPELLIEAAANSDVAELGSGLAFGSERVPNVLEITWSQAQRVPQKLRQDILVFDWWIQNDDRNLTPLGGNPNLLWDTAGDELVVIDHNAAFSQQFSPADFVNLHIFGSEWETVVGDCVHQAEYLTRIQQASEVFEEAMASCPKDWFWADFDVPAQFDRAAVQRTLQRFNEQNFWEIAR